MKKTTFIAVFIGVFIVAASVFAQVVTKDFSTKFKVRIDSYLGFKQEIFEAVVVKENDELLGGIREIYERMHKYYRYFEGKENNYRIIVSEDSEKVTLMMDYNRHSNIGRIDIELKEDKIFYAIYKSTGGTEPAAIAEADEFNPELLTFKDKEKNVVAILTKSKGGWEIDVSESEKFNFRLLMPIVVFNEINKSTRLEKDSEKSDDDEEDWDELEEN